MADTTPDRFVASAPPGGWADGPAHAVVEELDRGRHERWAAIVLLVVGLLAVVALLVVGAPSTSTRLWGAIAVIAVGVGLAIVIVQEWRARRASRAIADEQMRLRGLSRRLVAMEATADACRQVAEAEELDEVLTRALAGVRRIAAARTGAVLLRTGDELNVMAAGGADPPARGTRIPDDDGPAWRAVRTDETVQQVGPGGPWGGTSGTATLATPMALPGQVIGALVAERGRGQPAFTGSDRASLELLADHTALAVRAALRLERQRRAAAGREHGAATPREHRATPAGSEHDDLASLVGIVHDLKTPLATVSGYVQLLIEREERFTSARRQAVLRDVRGEVDRLKDLVDGVLQVARLASDERPMERLVDLAEVAREVQAAGRDLPHAQRSPRTVRVRASAAAIVVGDVASLRRIVENLVDDALSRELTGCPLEVAVERVDGWVELTVAQPPHAEGRTADGTGADEVSGMTPPAADDVPEGWPSVPDGLGEPSAAAGAREAQEPWTPAADDAEAPPPAPAALPTGLQVARILVELHGGTLELAGDGGACSRVRLPAI